MGRIVLEALKAAVDKVGTTALSTVAQTLSGAVNELKGRLDGHDTSISTINSKIPVWASASDKLTTHSDLLTYTKRVSINVNAFSIPAYTCSGGQLSIPVSLLPSDITNDSQIISMCAETNVGQSINTIFRSGTWQIANNYLWATYNCFNMSKAAHTVSSFDITIRYLK